MAIYTDGLIALSQDSKRKAAQKVQALKAALSDYGLICSAIIELEPTQPDAKLLYYRQIRELTPLDFDQTKDFELSMWICGEWIKPEQTYADFQSMTFDRRQKLAEQLIEKLAQTQSALEKLSG